MLIQIFKLSFLLLKLSPTNIPHQHCAIFPSHFFHTSLHQGPEIKPDNTVELIMYQSMLTLPPVIPHPGVSYPAPVRMQVVSSTSRHSRRGPVAPTAIANYDPSQPCNVTEDGVDCLSHGLTCETLKVFQCPRCNYKAKQAWNLQRHLKYHDKGRSVSVCIGALS